MRHGDKVNNLGRKQGHRKALLKNLSIALITHKRINTTLAKAKALRVHIEPLVTKAKDNTTHSRRVVFSYLQNKEAIKELFGPVAEKVATRPGGYVRIIKTGFRKGDGAATALIEFVDFNELLTGAGATQAGADAKKKRSRRGSSSAKKATTGAGAATAAAAVTSAAVANEIVETKTTTIVEETKIVEKGFDPEWDLLNDEEEA